MEEGEEIGARREGRLGGRTRRSGAIKRERREQEIVEYVPGDSKDIVKKSQAVQKKSVLVAS